MSIDPADPKIKVKDLKVGDQVDLESCPFLKNQPNAEFTYAEVVEIVEESPTCIVVDYDSGGTAGYDPEQVLSIKKRE